MKLTRTLKEVLHLIRRYWKSPAAMAWILKFLTRCRAVFLVVTCELEPDRKVLGWSPVVFLGLFLEKPPDGNHYLTRTRWHVACLHHVKCADGFYYPGSSWHHALDPFRCDLTSKYRGPLFRFRPLRSPEGTRRSKVDL